MPRLPFSKSGTEDRVRISADEISEQIFELNVFNDDVILDDVHIASIKSALKPRVGHEGELWLLELIQILKMFLINSRLRRPPGATEKKKVQKKLLKLADDFKQVIC